MVLSPVFLLQVPPIGTFSVPHPTRTERPVGRCLAELGRSGEEPDDAVGREHETWVAEGGFSLVQKVRLEGAERPQSRAHAALAKSGIKYLLILKVVLWKYA